VADPRGARDGQRPALHRGDDPLPRERIAEELPPLRAVERGDALVAERADGDEESQRHQEEGRVGEGERQRELPLALPCHLATSLLKRSIQPARSGLIFDQSCRTNFPISSSEAMGRLAADLTSRFTGVKLLGGCMSAVCTGALITVSKYL